MKRCVALCVFCVLVWRFLSGSSGLLKPKHQSPPPATYVGNEFAKPATRRL